MKPPLLALVLGLATCLFIAGPAEAQRRTAGPQRAKVEPFSDESAKLDAEGSRELLEGPVDAKRIAATKPSEFAPTKIPVPQTGQHVTAGVGDDGDRRKGQSWPDPRFADNHDGTVTDNLTGLVWHGDPSTFRVTTWRAALSVCNKLSDGEAGLSDGSKPGDWRLPNVRELESLIDYSQRMPALARGHPFHKVAAAIHWSSTTMLDSAKTPYRGPIVNAAWSVDLSDGRVRDCEKMLETHLWPVRDPREASGKQAAPQPVPLAPVMRTGQTSSWETGDDGDLQKGRPWPTPRFIDNQNGTVTDRLTGLVWLKDRRSLRLANWGEALTRCNDLSDGKAGLNDGSKPGDWRLPNVREFLSLVDYSQQDPALPRDHMFIKPAAASHWTSTIVSQKVYASFRMGLRSGGTGYSTHVGEDDVWPVRDPR